MRTWLAAATGAEDEGREADGEMEAEAKAASAEEIQGKREGKDEAAAAVPGPLPPLSLPPPPLRPLSLRPLPMLPLPLPPPLSVSAERERGGVRCRRRAKSACPIVPTASIKVCISRRCRRQWGSPPPAPPPAPAAAMDEE